ncbi:MULTISPECIES: hypothetical protein [unclassified Pseudoclavibacter]|uniref:hypothetical protein n=1 Tax=unclassified Pseudoclavibacter TaxID=2615177 RepID=UPI000CE8ABC2|nr:MULTISPECIES: hypothetical protein [unclassified Pseudoclavibacter]PPF75892.1 hypothetical protein C5B99_08450 [Pseudoclavibacter sp. Z016]PPG02789.1 hypothetical protein C5E06_10080 [Pseudoclavibacter sp. RFBI5]
MKKLLAFLCACTAVLLFATTAAAAPGVLANEYNEFDVGPELLSAEIVTPTTVRGGDTVRINWSVRSTRDIAYSAVDLANGTVFSPETRKILGHYDMEITGREGDIVFGTTSFSPNGPEWAPGEWRVQGLGFFDELGVHGGADEAYSPVIQALPKLQIDVGTDGDQEAPELIDLQVDAPAEVRQSDVIWFNWTMRESSRVKSLLLTITGPDGRSYTAEGFDMLTATREGDRVSGALHLTVNNFTWALGEYRVTQLTTWDEHENRLIQATPADNAALASAAAFTVVDSGGPDVTAPELLSAGFEQSTVRMGDEPDINWTIRDESDMDDVRFYLKNYRGTIYTMRGDGGDRLGEVLTGASGAWLTVTPYEEDIPKWGGGVYEVVGAELVDDYGNVTTLTSDHPIISGLPDMTVLPRDAPIPSRTPSPTITATPSPTATETPTASSTPTETPTGVPSPTTPDPTGSAAPSPTETAVSTASPTVTDSPTSTITASPTPIGTTSAPLPPIPASSTATAESDPSAPSMSAASAPAGHPTPPHSEQPHALASTGTDTLAPLGLLTSSLLALGVTLLLARKRAAKP